MGTVSQVVDIEQRRAAIYELVARNFDPMPRTISAGLSDFFAQIRADALAETAQKFDTLVPG